MASDLAELSSISSTLEQLIGRLGAMAETARQAREEDVASELFTVERGLASAQRRLSRMVERSR